MIAKVHILHETNKGRMKMKKTIMVIAIMAVMMLGACVPEEVEAVKPLETEMSDVTLTHFFGELTWRLVEANREEPGSYERKSFLDAAVAKSESSMRKLEEKYDPNIPVMISLKRYTESRIVLATLRITTMLAFSPVDTIPSILLVSNNAMVEDLNELRPPLNML